jgi:hypothetical protein
MNNPFSNYRDKVVIAMLLEICRKKRLKPEQWLESKVESDYKTLK